MSDRTSLPIADADSVPEPQWLTRLRQLAQSLPPVAVTTAADCYGYEDDEPETRWCIYDHGEDDPPLADYMLRSVAGEVADALNGLAHLVREVDRLRAAAKRAHDLIDEAYCGPDQPYAPAALEARTALTDALRVPGTPSDAEASAPVPPSPQRSPAEEKVVDLMEALEQSVREAREARARKLAAGLGVSDSENTQ